MSFQNYIFYPKKISPSRIDIKHSISLTKKYGLLSMYFQVTYMQGLTSVCVKQKQNNWSHHKKKISMKEQSRAESWIEQRLREFALE